MRLFLWKFKMSSTLGSLVVDLSANIAKFQSDMGKAAYIAQQNMEKINSAVEAAKKGLEALGIGLSIHEFTEMVKGTLEAADQLGKFSQKVGISVESL
jgi:methionine aminopeptidase